jgi:ribosomal-protein-alanine N-acetyltransferase
MTALVVDTLHPPLPPELAAVVAELHAKCFADVPGSGWSAQAFAALLDLPATRCWMLRNGDRPGGFLFVRGTGSDCEILTLGVAAAWRRHGRGRALMRTAAEWAAAAGLERAVLEVAVSNSPALGFYRRLGFDEAGRRPRYYRTPEGVVDALLLTAPINVLLNETG